MGIELKFSKSGGLLAHVTVRPLLAEHIRNLKTSDPFLEKKKQDVVDGKESDFEIKNDESLCYKNRICVPNDPPLKKDILEEAHSSIYSMHPGGTKMYKDLKEYYWWNNMKREIPEFVAKCLVCQQVKAEHQKPAELLQSLPIPEWKWEHITMDFVTGLPRSPKGHGSIWVIVYRLTKSAHFLPVKTTYTVDKYARMYVDEIIRLHGAPVSIVSDRDPTFTSKFWPRLKNDRGTSLKFSTAFHPQIDGQSEKDDSNIRRYVTILCAIEGILV